MTYVSWAAMYEGQSDRAYVELLIPRRPVEQFAVEACAARDAFQLIFVHADAGGRGSAEGLSDRSTRYCMAMHDRCAWSPVRCVIITPRHETEAWVLADPAAVTGSLGYVGSPASLGLPATARQAEELTHPKQVLKTAMTHVRGKRSRFGIQQIFPAIAQRQSLEALRQARSFEAFYGRLKAALADLQCL